MSKKIDKKIDDKITKEKFYFESSLYDKFSLDDLEDNFFNGDVDGYSNILHDNTTYKIDFEWVDQISSKYIEYPRAISVINPHHVGNMYHKGFAQITLTCKRSQNDIIKFFVYKDEINKNGILMKVGQFPSVADLEFQNLQKKYDKVLDKKYLREFKKAVGLYANGIGVGSFVYLRRIFENLIQEAFNLNKNSLAISGKEFEIKRINEKIEILKDFLPSQLIDLKEIYKILSQGVHTLNEEICLKHFSILKLAIELILDQKIENEQKRAKDEKVKNELSKISRELNNKK